MNGMKTTLLLILTALALLAPGPAWGAAGEWSVNPQSSVRLITAWDVAPQTGELWMGFHFKLAPGWHVYWKNSGDAGFPPAATFKPAEVLGEPELLWPTPHRFELPGGLVAFGYADEVIYPVLAKLAAPPAPTPAGTPPPEAADAATSEAAEGGEVQTFTADLDYLVCEVDCIPYRYTLTIEQPMGGEPVADPETAPLIQAWLDRLPRTVQEVQGVTTGAVLNAGRPDQPALEIRVAGARAETGKTDLFLETLEGLDTVKPRMRITPDGVVFHVTLKPRETKRALPARLPIAWTVSNLVGKDGKSFNLEAKRDVAVVSGSGGEPTAPAAAPAGGMPRLLLWAFLGGALLNLMPTVLALLAAEGSALRGSERPGLREKAAAAATGVLGSCWAFAALALAAQRFGLPAGWGTQLQEPAVAGLLAVASALLTLNLWGLVDFPLAPAGAAADGTGRHLLAGLFTTPLALAWPVPLLQEPLSYAFGRGPVAVATVFAVVGFGLALPYLLVALVPAVLRALPAPGSRLPRLREGLGFLAGAGSFWLLYAMSPQVSPEGLAWIELALLGMALLAWLRHRQDGRRALRFVLALGLFVCAAGVPYLADRNRLTPRVASETRVFDSTAGLPREPNSNTIPGG